MEGNKKNTNPFTSYSHLTWRIYCTINSSFYTSHGFTLPFYT